MLFHHHTLPIIPHLQLPGRIPVQAWWQASRRHISGNNNAFFISYPMTCVPKPLLEATLRPYSYAKIQYHIGNDRNWTGCVHLKFPTHDEASDAVRVLEVLPLIRGHDLGCIP